MYRKYLNSERSLEVAIAEFNLASGDEVMVQISGVESTKYFEEQLENLVAEIEEVTRQVGCTPIFRRFFVSDAANQSSSILAALERLPRCATSIVEQPPLNGAKVAVWLYLQSGVSVSPVAGGLYRVERDGVTHYWSGSAQTTDGDSHTQMRRLFEEYIEAIESQGCTLLDNCIRTWLFVQNVDVNYAGVVTGRNEIFDEQGLIPQTHYISSTGIQGRSADHRSLVQMDGYSVKGISQDQIQILYAPTHLNPTYEYGVSFERGTAVHYADRSHAFISGTASIDNRGDVLFVGDIRRQTERMWENVEVLLAEAKFTMDDIAHMIVYLRDIADYQLVKAMFESRFPETPFVILYAPVCRPTWLIEMECVAIREKR